MFTYPLVSRLKLPTSARLRGEFADLREAEQGGLVGLRRFLAPARALARPAPKAVSPRRSVAPGSSLWLLVARRAGLFIDDGEVGSSL